jgi:hypothetical protein
MPSLRTRLPLLVAVAAVALSATTGNALSPAVVKPQVVDKRGDSVGNQGTADVVSAWWHTTGETTTTKSHGRKVTTYTPKKLVVTLSLAAAPTQSAPFDYETSAQVAGCGTVRFMYTPGTVFGQVLGNGTAWIDCGDETDPTGSNLMLIDNVDVAIGAKSVTWTVSLKSFPKHVRVGSKLSSFAAAVHVVDPVEGADGTTDTGTPLDEGAGTGTWVLR